MRAKSKDTVQISTGDFTNQHSGTPTDHPCEHIISGILCNTLRHSSEAPLCIQFLRCVETFDEAPRREYLNERYVTNSRSEGEYEK